MSTISAIIQGKRYSTETADEICDISDITAETRMDFTWEDTRLYRSKLGAFFIAGEGHCRSRWATTRGNRTSAGSGLVLVSEDEARDLVEQFGTEAAYALYFGVPAEG